MSSLTPQIAIVEDDPRLSAHLSELLSHLGWRACAFGRAELFFSALRRRAFDAVLLDLCLPDLSTTQLLHKLPQELRGRTLALTGRMDDWVVEESFSAGLADFLLKPCRLLDLKCRIGRILRNKCELTSLESQRAHLGLPMGSLTHKERLCAEYLLARLNTIVSREELLWQVWRLDERISSRRVDTYVSRIRQKLGLDRVQGVRLVSIYGSGYRMETAP